MSRNRTDREKQSAKPSGSRSAGKKPPAASEGTPGKRGSAPRSQTRPPTAAGSYRSSEVSQKDASSLTTEQAIKNLFPAPVVRQADHDANALRQDLDQVRREKDAREAEE